MICYFFLSFSYFTYFVFSISLPEKISYREAQNQGLSISEVKYLRLSKQAKELVKSIKKKIGTI